MTTYDYKNIGEARILIQILKFIGHWPWENVNDLQQNTMNARFHRYYRYILHLPLTFTYVSLMWLQAFTSQNIEEASNVLYMSFTETALVIKILNIWYFSDRAQSYIEEVENNVEFKLHTAEERKLWQREQHAFGRVAFYYIAVSLGVVVSAYIGVLFISTYELPFDYWVPFEWHNKQNYWYAYFYELLAMPLTCISNITLDMMWCYFMFHIALLYKILGLRLEMLQHFNENEVAEKFVSIFKMHSCIRRLTPQCELLVSKPILAQIIFSAFILCFSGYRIQNSDITANIGQFIAMIQFLSVMTLQIFLPCYYANEITINSNRLTTCVYNSKWLHFSKSTQKLIFIYMEFLKKPEKIKVANFFEVGLTIFTKTMNNAYSFFAVLLNMNN